MPSLKLGATVVLAAAIVIAAIGIAVTFLNTPPRIAPAAAAPSQTPGQILAASDSPSPSVATVSGTDICGLDVSWLRRAVPAARFEADGGTLALQRSTDPTLRTLAQRLVADQGQSSTELEALASKLAIAVQASSTPTQEWILAELKEMSPSSFAHDYPELVEVDNAQLAEEARLETDRGCNDEVRALASRQVPVLEELGRLAHAAVPAGSGE